MSETTSSTYEIRRSSRESIPAGLRLDKLDDLVGLDKAARADYARDKEGVQSSYEEYAEALIATRLRQNGIQDSANDEAQHAEYEYAKGLYTNVSKLSEVEWLTTPPDADVKRRTLVLRELLDRYDRDETQTKNDDEKPEDALPEPKAAGTDEDNESGARIITPEHLRAMDLEALANAKHNAFAAKLNAPVFGKKRRQELMEAYTVAEQAYLAALRTHLEQQVHAQFPDGSVDRATLKEFIEQEVNTRARADEAAQRTALIEQGGARAKFLDWYANQSTGKKILVGVGAGIGLGLVGVGLGAIAGVVGGAAGAMGAGGAMAFSRFGRGYAMRMSAIYKRPTKQPEFTIQDDSTESTSGFYDQSTGFMRKISREQIKHAEDIKKSAVVVAMGTVALGGMIGTSIHMAGIAGEAANDHWPAGYLQHREIWGLHNDVNPTDQVTLPGSSTTTNSGGLDTNPSDNEGFNPNPDHNPQKPDFKILGNDEHTISKGEGWYETLREMGVSSDDRAELLKEVGPHLHEKGLAYWDGKADEWRMNMTENGKLPKSAIEYIARTAHENNIHTNYDKFFGDVDVDNDVTNTVDNEVAEYADGRDESIITPGEGGREFMREIGVDADARAELWNDVAPKLDDDLTYRTSDGEWRLNMTDDGLMPVSAIETAADVAHSNGIETNYTDIIEAGNHLTGNNSFTANELVTSYNRDMQPYYDALKGVDPKYRDNVLLAAANELQSFNLTEKVNGVWRFREVDSLPSKAEEAIRQIASKNQWMRAV